MKALLVDGFNLIRRIYAAIPAAGSDSEKIRQQKPSPEENSPPPDPEYLEGIIRSCSASLTRALKFHRPSHAVVVFEVGSPTWRHRLYPDYKKNRSPMPRPLAQGLPLLRQRFETLGVHTIERPGYEADDVIATMANKIAHTHGHAVILSTDRHHCQLLGPYVTVYDHFGQRFLDRDVIFERFGVEPDKLPLLFALAGDAGHSIPGIAGVGLRTAARLVNEYGDLDTLLAAAETMTGKIGAKLYSGAEEARMGLQLFTLKTDIELGINLNQFRYQAA